MKIELFYCLYCNNYLIISSLLIVIIEFSMDMVIGNEELNLIVLSQFYSIIDCYVFYYFH
jgi:hypothetical protein